MNSIQFVLIVDPLALNKYLVDNTDDSEALLYTVYDNSPTVSHMFWNDNRKDMALMMDNIIPDDDNVVVHIVEMCNIVERAGNMIHNLEVVHWMG